MVRMFLQTLQAQQNHFALIIALALITLPYALFVAPPQAYPIGGTIHVETGEPVGTVAAELESLRAIHSPLAFKIFVAVLGDSGVQAGSYSLSDRQNVVALAYRFSTGATGLDSIKVTIPEGSTSWDMAEILKSTLKDFEDAQFLELAKNKEGYLFPDTYFFQPGTPPDVVIRTMQSAYEQRVSPLREKFAAAGKSEEEIIIMASLLQKEARKPDTMKIISGILWKRISMGMPLQVDAVFGYIHERDTFNPSFNDLEIDSPYNTYKNKGLPPGPISNPGLDAILAALEPTTTPYLYYLTGKDGVMRYAKTFDVHVANRAYLR